jgi:hypothetical protein
MWNRETHVALLPRARWVASLVTAAWLQKWSLRSRSDVAARTSMDHHAAASQASLIATREASADLYGLPGAMISPMQSLRDGVDPRTIPGMPQCPSCSSALCSWCIHPRCPEDQWPLDATGWCSACDGVPSDERGGKPSARG